jgi:hypothetical protein
MAHEGRPSTPYAVIAVSKAWMPTCAGMTVGERLSAGAAILTPKGVNSTYAGMSRTTSVDLLELISCASALPGSNAANRHHT